MTLISGVSINDSEKNASSRLQFQGYLFSKEVSQAKPQSLFSTTQRNAAVQAAILLFVPAL